MTKQELINHLFEDCTETLELLEEGLIKEAINLVRDMQNRLADEHANDNPE